MNEAKLKTILAQLQHANAEYEIVEFKEAKNNYDFNKLGTYFSALCNEANLKGKEYAWLIFGIVDKGKTVVGSQYSNSNRAQLLRNKGLIEGKKTNYIISEKVATSAKQVAAYLNLKGESTAYCMQKILELVRINNTGTHKKEIRELLKNKLSENLNDKQRDNRISYFLKKLKEEGLIENKGTDKVPNWIPKNNNLE